MPAPDRQLSCASPPVVGACASASLADGASAPGDPDPAVVDPAVVDPAFVDPAVVDAAAGDPSTGTSPPFGITSPALSGLSDERVARAISSWLTLSGWWQAARWPPEYAANGGSISAQTSVARGHRVRNRQPEGGLIGLGSSPLITVPCLARACSGSGTGIVAISPAV
jgi:hypothetical protein